jgi:stress-induced-phosphoprotein 1
MARKANALAKLGRMEESLLLFKDALLEDNDFSIKDQMKKVEREKKEAERLAYLSPEKSEENRVKGNGFFEEGKFREAIEEYNEGLKRNPDNIKIYSNRCFAYIKVLDLGNALKDADKCLEVDPKMVKAWVRKGNVHHLMKEFHKAISAFDQGLKLEPDNKDLKQGKMKTMMAIQTGATDGKTDEERLRHAMADPEIQGLMRDPRVV